MLEDKNGHCRKAEVLAMGNTIKKEREWCLEKGGPGWEDVEGQRLKNWCV